MITQRTSRRDPIHPQLCLNIRHAINWSNYMTLVHLHLEDNILISLKRLKFQRPRNLAGNHDIAFNESLSTISLPYKELEKTHIASWITDNSASLESLAPTKLENMINTSPLMLWRRSPSNTCRTRLDAPYALNLNTAGRGGDRETTFFFLNGDWRNNLFSLGKPLGGRGMLILFLSFPHEAKGSLKFKTYYFGRLLTRKEGIWM